MAAFIPAPNCARVEMRFTQQGQQVENVYHVKGSSPQTSDKLLDICTAFIDWWTTSMQGITSNQVSLNSVKATALDTATSVGVETSAGLPVLGTDTSPALPMNVTFAVKWLTGLRGRSFSGRTYHIGITRVNVTDSKLTPGTAAAFAGAYGELIETSFGDAQVLAVVSYRHAKAPRATAVATQITGTSVNETLDSQRRRLPERGA